MKLKQRWQTRHRNRERILQVADDVETSGSFQMDVYQHSCGTAGCIAGHACARAVSEGVDGGPDSVALVAVNYFEIPKADTARRSLFMPRMHRDGFHLYSEPDMTGYITREHAAACLRHFARTGVVDWKATAPAA